MTYTLTPSEFRYALAVLGVWWLDSWPSSPLLSHPNDRTPSDNLAAHAVAQGIHCSTIPF